MAEASLQYSCFRLKKNLTEINHKVSVLAKRFLLVIRCVCGEMRETAQNPTRNSFEEAVMQEEVVGSWHESHLSPDVLGSLHDLNHRFLELAAVRTGWMGVELGSLSAAQRAAAAGCPYALFDLRFQDDRHWQARLQTCESWCVADEISADDATRSFVRLALFYAWHVALRTGLAAQLLLGMTAGTADAFRRITVNQLPALAATEAEHLTARWSGCAAYWSSLIAAAARAEPKALRRVQLYGLQLSAAARLPDS